MSTSQNMAATAGGPPEWRNRGEFPGGPDAVPTAVASPQGGFLALISIIAVLVFGCKLVDDKRVYCRPQIVAEVHRAYLCEGGVIPLRTRSVPIESNDFAALDALLGNGVRCKNQLGNVPGIIGKCYSISVRNPSFQYITKYTFSERGALCGDYSIENNRTREKARNIIMKYISRLKDNDNTSVLVDSKLLVSPQIYDFKCIDTDIWSRAIFAGYVINCSERDVAIRAISNANHAVRTWVSSSNICHNSCIGIELGIDMKCVTNTFSGSISFITDLPATNEFKIYYKGEVIGDW